MKRFWKISVFSLLLLAALSFTGNADALAQGKKEHKHKKEKTYKKAGPPDWAPAHGYRRKNGENNHHDHHKGKYKDRDQCCAHDDDRYARKENKQDRDRDDRYEESSKRRSTKVIKKKRDPETTRSGKKVVLDPRQAKLEPRDKKQREVNEKTPTHKEGDWTHGHGW